MNRIFRDREAREQPFVRFSFVPAAFSGPADPLPVLRFMDISGARPVPARRIRHRGGPMGPRKIATLVGVVMGSDSDWEIMRHAAAQLDAFGVAYEARVLSAHRMPDDMLEYAEDAGPRGLRCIIAGAGGAAHLPGMLASKTVVPVLGVPVPSKYLRGEDSLYSIVQMPKGIPVATFAIGEAGAANAGLFAVAILAGTDPAVARKLAAFRLKQTNAARAMRVPPVA
jgi:5-(carboxyamino)imidazole ribonucleotide mutase